MIYRQHSEVTERRSIGAMDNMEMIWFSIKHS